MRYASGLHQVLNFAVVQSGQPSGPIENTLCAYETIEELNKRLYPELHGIVESNFFRHWKVGSPLSFGSMIS